MNRYLARYTLSQKLLASSLAFLLPLGLLLWYAVSGYNTALDGARRERAGAGALDPLRSLAEGLATHQRAQYMTLRGFAAGGDLDRSARAIDAALSTLAARGTGVNQERLRKTAGDWQRLKAQTQALTPDDSYLRHQNLRDTVQNLFREVGDSNGLVLDSEIESYYLMDAALLSLPQMQSDLHDLMMSADRDLIHGSGSDIDRASFNAYSTRLDWTAPARLGEKLATALRRDRESRGAESSLQQHAPAAVTAYGKAAEAFLDALGSVNPNDARSATALLNRGEVFAAAGSAVWKMASAELIVLLDARISSLWWRRFACIVLSLLAAGFASSILLVVSRSLSLPLQRVADVADRIAAGRLDDAGRELSDDAVRELMGRKDMPAWTRDETWRLVNSCRTMVWGLKDLLQQVRVSGVQVNSSATQTASSVAQLETTVAEQATSTSEIAATSKEIYATAIDRARTMNEVTVMAGEAANLADSGVALLDGLNQTVEALVEGTSDVNQILASIREDAQRISKVIETIGRIANRTNLISLNAAIEAEKAGTNAAGFSVVAVEIRRLADQTAVAALEIEDSILQMQGAVENGVAGVQEFSSRARASSLDITNITRSLGQMIDRTRKLGPHFEAVNQGMQAQAEGAGQIHTAIERLNEASAQTRAALGGLRDSAQGLRGAVSGLQAGVARFSAEG